MLNIQPKLNCFYPVQHNVFLVVMVLAILVIVALFYKQILADKVYAVLVGLIIGGGVFHLLERITNRCVLDYFRLGPLYFNFVDIIIVTSVVFLILYTYAQEQDNPAS